jgi:hypothetical protein
MMKSFSIKLKRSKRLQVGAAVEDLYNDAITASIEFWGGTETMLQLTWPSPLLLMQLLKVPGSRRLVHRNG